jgi:hypothetical protein
MDLGDPTFSSQLIPVIETSWDRHRSQGWAFHWFRRGGASGGFLILANRKR